MALAPKAPFSSFSTQKINSTTFVVEEHDAYGESPSIYVKLHPKAPVIIISDTGCDKPHEKYKDAEYTHLRDYLEQFPLSCNGNRPLNPDDQREYIIICSHCHFDHIGGISQFLRGGTTRIIASAAGRDFIESDLETNGLFNFLPAPAPWYKVTDYVHAFEKLTHEERSQDGPKVIDLGITFIQTPGHTPDSLAWYDHHEMHLYVGDSVYEEGEAKMEILWPPQGNLVEWEYSMQKLERFVRSENYKAVAKIEGESNFSDWKRVARRVKLGAGHQTQAADAAEILVKVARLFRKVLKDEVPVVKTREHLGELYLTWKEQGWGMFLSCPARLMDDARSFFGHSEQDHSIEHVRSETSAY